MLVNKAPTEFSLAAGTTFGIVQLCSFFEQELNRNLNTLGGTHRLRCLLEVANAGATAADLSENEKIRLETLDQLPKKPSWLLGRAALKKLLRRLGRDSDTSMVKFPNPELSLTHSNSMALAAVITLQSSTQRLIGVGIDFEDHRPISLKTAKFFLHPDELALFGDLSERSLLQLWTIKEALFKSDPDNAQKMPGHIRLLGTAETGGATDDGNSRKHFCYASLPLYEGFLSLAICTEDYSDAHRE